jgi:hypothetical protein
VTCLDRWVGAFVGPDEIMGWGCGGACVVVGVELGTGRGDGYRSAASNLRSASTCLSTNLGSLRWSFHARTKWKRNNRLGKASTSSRVPFARRVNNCN